MALNETCLDGDAFSSGSWHDAPAPSQLEFVFVNERHSGSQYLASGRRCHTLIQASQLRIQSFRDINQTHVRDFLTQSSVVQVADSPLGVRLANSPRPFLMNALKRLVIWRKKVPAFCL